MREVLEVATYLLSAAAWARAGRWDELADDMVEQAAAILHLPDHADTACLPATNSRAR